MRLAGLWNTAPSKKNNALVQCALQASSAVPQWKIATETSDDLAMGLCGVNPATAITRQGDVLAMLDGWLYNRDELGAYTTDAEAVAGLYRQFGFEETLRRLNGDFAIALYDTTSRSLWLARDRIGVKPLYYLHSGDRFAFASRPAGLLALPEVNRAPNPTYVAVFAGSHYRYFDNDPDTSPYAAIRQLPAGQMLRLADGRLTKSIYWTLSDGPDHDGTEEELAERYRELLFDAVQRRLRVATRPCFTLSGGMDSSSVLASAVRLTGRKQHAFSSVYDDKTYDESAEIRSILDATVEEWHAIRIGAPDVFAFVGKMIAVNDEPIATATWLPHYIVCEEAARLGFDGLFGGLGGDELNAGEYEHFFFHFADLRSTGRTEEFNKEVQMWAHHHDHPIFRKSIGVVEDAFTRLVDLRCPGKCMADRARMLRYAGALNPDYFDLYAFIPMMDHPFRSYLKNRTYQDMMRETIPCCLRAEDRQSAAFGLMNFLPFFDHRLVEFMFRIPGTLKYREGATKHLLRQAMRGVLPDETRTRVKKTGWNAPAHVWFARKGAESLHDLVRTQSFRERGIYNVTEVCRLIDEHDRIVACQETRDNHMMFLWQLVNLELWLQSLDNRN